MQLSNVLHMLLGAALVAIGVLATALADRLRGIERTSPRKRPRASRRKQEIQVVEAAELLHPPTKRERAPRSQPQTSGEEVITALVAAGYKKHVASEATWACSPAERQTVEAWTAAALRRCVRGSLS